MMGTITPTKFEYIIDNVEPTDVLKYILSAINGQWAPYSHWSIHDVNGKMFSGELRWIVYSYLVYNNLLIVDKSGSIYRDRLSYYNPFEVGLYDPIIKKMVDQKYLTHIPEIGRNFYKLGPLYRRFANLEELL